MSDAPRAAGSHFRLVRWLARGIYGSGSHQTAWDGRDETGSPVAPGLYFLRSTSGGRIETLKVTVLR